MVRFYMSLRFIHKQTYLIAIVAIILFLFVYSIRHLSIIINSSLPVAVVSQHSSSMLEVSNNHDSCYLLTKKSECLSNCTVFNHCSLCNTLIPNIVLNVEFSPHSEQYLSYNFAPQFKEFIPELKPPKVA